MASPKTPNYRALDPEKLVATLEKLTTRISERFPNAGLNRVAAQLLDVAHRTGQNAATLERPIWWVRIVDLLLVAVIVTTLVVAVLRTQLPSTTLDLAQGIVLVESGLNDLVLIGAALFFLFTLENRIKRQRALKDLHELRSLAHVIDMHQLTKDPDRILLERPATASSPVHSVTAYELSRYLDYCSELLSLVGKLAALYVQHFNDPVVQQAVDEIESLTTGLSQKVWQKVMILYEMVPEQLGVRGDDSFVATARDEKANVWESDRESRTADPVRSPSSPR